MWKVAQFIKKEILVQDQWVLAGTFNDFENPSILHTLLKWILLGTSNHIENETCRKGIDRCISGLSLYHSVNQNFKTGELQATGKCHSKT